jgi:hypothetical protein
MDDLEYWALQVWSNRKGREFWGVSFWSRKPTDEKGTASFVDATPNFEWMRNRSIKEVMAYLRSKKVDGWERSFTHENDRLLQDLRLSSRK